MRRWDSGEGRWGIILTLAVLSTVTYAGIKTLPAYVQNYRLGDYIRDLAVRATVYRFSAEAVRSDVVTYARRLDLPASADSVKVTATPARVRIELDYVVPVDLMLYTWALHFTPATENRALL